MTQASILEQLQQFLYFAASRERTISSNMANIDTPGYHAKDVDFHTALTQEMGGTNAAWDQAGKAMSLQPVIREVPGLMERSDGNNVDLDRESLLLAETQLQYQFGIQLIKRQFHQILSAINGN